MAVSALLLWCSSVAAVELEYRGGYASLGTLLGVAGLAVGDVDGDGSRAILVTGSTEAFDGSGFFSLIRADPLASHGYREISFSEVFESGPSTATLLDLAGNGVDKVVVGFPDGSIHVYRGSTLKEDASTSVLGGVKQFLLADADNDGSTDLVVLSAAAVTLLDPVTLRSRGSVPYAGAEMAIGDVDGDGAAEVVLNTGTVLRLSRSQLGLSAETLWRYADGSFGIHIGLADIDGDGKLELIAESWRDFLTAFDVDIRSQKWQIDGLNYLTAMTLADLNGDGVPDAILGDESNAETAIDLTTRAVLWSLPKPPPPVGGGTGHIVVADIDGDGQADMVLTDGWESGGQNVLYAYALPELSEEFETLDINGPFDTVAVFADAAAPRVAFASSYSAGRLAGGFVWQWDAGSLMPLTETPGSTFGNAFTGLRALVYGLGPENMLRLFVGSDHNDNGALYILDAATGELFLRLNYGAGLPISTLAVDDLDGNGHADVVAGDMTEFLGSLGTHVYIIDAYTEAEEWHSSYLDDRYGQVLSIATGDLDGDGYKDIVAVIADVDVPGGRLIQFTDADHRQWKSDASGYCSVAAFDLNGDRHAEVFAGKTDGRIDVLDGETHAVISRLAVGEGPVTAVRVFRSLISGRVLVASAVDGRLRVSDALTGQVVTTSAARIGTTRGLDMYQDVQDQRTDIFVGGDVAFRAYRFDEDVIFADGFD